MHRPTREKELLKKTVSAQHPFSGWVVTFPVFSSAVHIIQQAKLGEREREFLVDNLLVSSHLIIVMIRWTGRAPWELEFPFLGSPTCTSTFLEAELTI